MRSSIGIIQLLVLLVFSFQGQAQECRESAAKSELLAQVVELDSAVKYGFISDLCTGYREGTRHNPQQWQQCCVLHDLRLWAGGTGKQRRRADKLLRQCVRDSGSSLHASLMWLGVRIGSLSPIKIKGKQWGNAWGDKTRKTALSSQEISEIEQSLRNESSLSENEIQSFIQELQTN